MKARVFIVEKPSQKIEFERETLLEKPASQPNEAQKARLLNAHFGIFSVGEMVTTSSCFESQT